MPLQLDIVTPEKKVFSDTVDSVLLPGADGEIGVLPMHAGLVTALQPGELRYSHQGKSITLAVGSGFAEVTQEKVVVLTDMALGEDEIDEKSAEDAIRRAEEKLKNIEHSTNAEEVAYLEGLISRSSFALHFKKKYRH
jgi:F-type H+-transporting ATPase subunit epsilon